MDHADGVVVVLLRRDGEDHAPFVDLNDVEAHQLRDRRRRDPALHDRPQERGTRERERRLGGDRGILPGHRASALDFTHAQASSLPRAVFSAANGNGDVLSIAMRASIAGFAERRASGDRAGWRPGALAESRIPLARPTRPVMTPIPTLAAMLLL